jgi:hypothetical protein
MDLDIDPSLIYSGYVGSSCNDIDTVSVITLTSVGPAHGCASPPITRFEMVQGKLRKNTLSACAIIYRFAPSRAHARWRWIIPGAALASVVWLIASIVFSAYLANFNAYNATFGSLGAVAALLMWFWLSAYATCMGAELNSQLELFTTQDTTVDGPARPGERGAYVADHIEEPSEAHGPTPQAEDVTMPQELERVTSSRLRSKQSPTRKTKP